MTTTTYSAGRIDGIITGRVRTGLAVIVVLGVLFQIGHFTEHAIQFGVWIFGDRSAPWMSGIAMWLTHFFGSLIISEPASGAMMSGREMMVGMEVLHLGGNLIFLVTLAGLCHFMPSRQMKWAFGIEAFHLVEHLMLTSSVIWLGKPIGMSTLFGYAPSVFDHEMVVGYRVGWHFCLNLIPSVFMMVAMMKTWSMRNRI